MFAYAVVVSAVGRPSAPRNDVTLSRGGACHTRDMTRTLLVAAASAAASLAIAASPALAGPNEDYTGVKRNWAEHNQVIQPCRFTEGQLFNAVMVSANVPDDNYNSFRNAATAEYNRVKNGGCVQLRPGVSAPRNSKVRLT